MYYHLFKHLLSFIIIYYLFLFIIIYSYVPICSNCQIKESKTWLTINNLYLSKAHSIVTAIITILGLHWKCMWKINNKNLSNLLCYWNVISNFKFTLNCLIRNIHWWTPKTKIFTTGVVVFRCGCNSKREESNWPVLFSNCNHNKKTTTPVMKIL